MAYFTHVLDVAVNDFPAAAERFTLLTGVEGVPQWEEYEPSGTTDGIHFPVGGLSALGVLAPTSRPVGPTATMLARVLEARGEGPVMLGFSVPDLAQTVKEMRDRGVSFAFSEPMRVGDETLVTTRPVCGTVMVVAQHDEGHWERWARGELRDATRQPPAVTTRHRVDKATAIHFATTDLERQAAAFEALLGEKRRPARWPHGENVAAVEFPLEGLETLRVVTLTGSPRSALDQQLLEFIERRGDGVFALSFEVASTHETTRELRDRGVTLHDDPHDPGVARTDAEHGLVFEYRDSSRSLDRTM